MLFRVLGPVEIDGTDAVSYIRADKPRALLALLLVKANSWVGVGEIVDTVWSGRTPPVSAERNIGTYIWQLRRTLPPLGVDGQRIESRSKAYRIRVEAGELDSDRLQALLAAGGDALWAGDAPTALKHLEAARSLWRGTPYEGLVTDQHQPEVTRLAELHWSVRERLADALIGTARFADAVALCKSLTTEDPLRETNWARLVVAYRDAGRRADALATYQKARAALVGELGTEPGQELRALQQQLLSDVPEEHPKPEPTGPDAYVRTVLEAAGALDGEHAVAAHHWFTTRHVEFTTAVRQLLAEKDVANAWLLTSALHQFVETGGDVPDWAPLVSDVAAAARAGKDWYGELITRNILGSALTRTGRLTAARAEFTAALGIASVHDDRDAEGTVLVNLAMAEASGGARQQAAEYFRRALRLLREGPIAAEARQALAELGEPEDPARATVAS
ncbi:DNA-binding SARP family transcriptional activator [Kribbella aluminosa]|uniref:DNA-binding SARP family transcriptional activator n=1 Tax=Kribbella aluminosa TaxID=416017 RepID=A0ABS4USM1_9ACTN|nr:BTAD domain-containing putative transcriptional regulator [Kribbella aluminosa]MBP2354638.1 DNA-binding SARP family transcriptional activator [Kribbella aluminosa]